MRCRVADLMFVVVVEQELAVVELHLEYGQRADARRLVSSRKRVVVQVGHAFRHSCHGRRLRGTNLGAVRELALRGLCVLYALVAVGLALDDLLAAGLERVAEALRAGPEVSVRAVAVQLVVGLDPVLLIESLLSLVAAVGILGLERLVHTQIVHGEMTMMRSVRC